MTGFAERVLEVSSPSDLSPGEKTRCVFVQPNSRAGGAEIVGHWPSGRVAYIGGALKSAGSEDITFIDATTNHNR